MQPAANPAVPRSPRVSSAANSKPHVKPTVVTTPRLDSDGKPYHILRVQQLQQQKAKEEEEREASQGGSPCITPSALATAHGLGVRVASVPTHILDRAVDAIRKCHKPPNTPQVSSEGHIPFERWRSTNGPEQRLERDLGVAEIDNWPVEATSKLMERVGKQIVQFENEKDPVVRSNGLVQVLETLGSSMQSFKSVFDVLAVEVKLLATKYADSERHAQRATERLERGRNRAQEELTRATAHQSKLIREAQQAAEQYKNEAAEAKAALEASKGKTAELERLRQQLQEETEQMVASKHQHEAMAGQYAARNKALHDQIPALEKEAEEQRARAEEAHITAKRYEQAISQMEHDMHREQAEHKSALDKLAAYIERMQVDLKATSASLKVCKGQRDKAEASLEEALRANEEMRRKHEDDLVCMTPRPTFRPTFTPWFGGLSSTSNRVEIISARLERVTALCDDLQRANDAMEGALDLKQLGMDSSRQMPQRTCAVDLQPVAAPPGKVLPPYLATGHPLIKCRAMLHREVVARVRELFESQSSLATRTNRRVEMHACLVSDLLERNAAEVESSGALPLPLTEQCYALAYAAQLWSSAPIIRLFACVLREEVGVWVWHEQTKFILEIMLALSLLGTAPIADHFETIRRHCCTYGIGEDGFLALRYGFLQYYVVNPPPPEPLPIAPRKLSLDAVGKRRGKLSKMSTSDQSPLVEGVSFPTDAAQLAKDISLLQQVSGGTEINARVEWDPSRHHPANLATGIEMPFVSFMRRIHLERTVGFNNLYDRTLRKAATASKERLTFASCVSALLEVACTDEGTANKFVADVFVLCSQQLKAEKALAGNPAPDASPTVVPGAQPVFLPGYTRYYIGSQCPYPKIKLVPLADVQPRKSRKLWAQPTPSSPLKPPAIASPSAEPWLTPHDLAVPEQVWNDDDDWALDAVDENLIAVLAPPTAAPAAHKKLSESFGVSFAEPGNKELPTFLPFNANNSTNEVPVLSRSIMKRKQSRRSTMRGNSAAVANAIADNKKKQYSVSVELFCRMFRKAPFFPPVALAPFKEVEAVLAPPATATAATRSFC